MIASRITRNGKWVIGGFRFRKLAYSIRISQASSDPDTGTKIPIENKSISQYMKEYKKYFPRDKVSNSLIESYQRLHTYPQETIKIGVIYHDNDIRQNSRILETILADPLASNNQVWFDEISTRDKTQNLRFEYSTEPDINQNRYSIPAPVLGSVSRPSYMIPNTSVTLNDVVLYEINNLETFTNFHTCHFFVYVTDKITSTIKLPETIGDRILVTVIDNNNFTPSSSESSPFPDRQDGTVRIIKIDSEKSFSGITDFLINDTKASNNYLQSLVDSNIFQLLKIFGYNLQIDKLINWNLSKLINKLSHDEITLESLEKLYVYLKTQKINDFSSKMHHELQNEFIPLTTSFFNKKLRWWKLYVKNDNVEYDLKDHFNVNFMPKSIENYNFLRGKIISELQNHNYGDYHVKQDDISNPLIELKRTLISSRITTEIQSQVNSNLFYGMLYYQLPISILAVGSYTLFDFTLNGSGAIFALGMVMGFNYVLKNWEIFTKKWLQNLFEEVRVCIDRDCVENGLLKELTSSYNEEKLLIEIKREIVNGIKYQINK